MCAQLFFSKPLICLLQLFAVFFWLKNKAIFVVFPCLNLMGAKSLGVLKTHVGSINISFVNDFLCGIMLWAFGSLRILICNWVLYLFEFILRYITRFLHVGDEKNEVIVQPSQADSEGNGFSEELASFLFWSEDVYEAGGEREAESSLLIEDSEKKEDETESSIFMDSHSDIHEDSDETEVYTENSVSKEDGVGRGTEEDASEFTESDSDNSSVAEGGKKREGEMDSEKVIEDDTECSVFKENVSDVYHESIEKEEETRKPVSVDIGSNIHEDNKKPDECKTESSVLMESRSSSSFHEYANKKIDENQVEFSVFTETEPNIRDDSKKTEKEKESKEEEEETEVPFFVETALATSTSKCQYMSGKDTISGFMEETSAMSFSFREFYMGPDVLTFSNNSCTNTKIIAYKELSVLDSEESVISQEETEYSVPEQISTPSNTDTPFRFDSKAFGGTDSSDEDGDTDVLFNENSSVVSDSESESSCSSGLIWGNSYKVEDSISYQFLGGKSVDEGFESEILKLMLREERIEGVFDEKQFSCDEYIEMDPSKKGLKSMKIEHGFAGVDLAGAIDKDQKETGKHEENGFKIGLEKSEEAKWEEMLSDSDSNDHDYEDDFEWEHDDLVEQLKLELRNARQGGLATILEEDEDDEDDDEKVEEEKVMESPKAVEDFEPLKIEERLEYKDQLDEIEKVYKSYAEKMRKLDILNYQTMHALGLIQLKDPLKLIPIPNSTKPTIISQNLWPRKSSNKTSDPILKFVHELQRDLELVYVGQVCLSWEILSWQHKKAQELQQYETQDENHRYNIVAGELQLFQVLMQRFIENEAFQGPRIQNYVKNRCVIRNLLQVPAIKDDSMKDKNITKEDEEVPIGSGRLADIIKESMRVFWEFLKADKDYGNLILRNDLKDPTISVLIEDIRTQLPKKEKRLKDIVRTGNCIVKKFQKHHEDELDHEQLIAQVGLRLISRVLSTSRLTKEQLIWCHHKLQRIIFLNRKIVQVEPSFLLFPC